MKSTESKIVRRKGKVITSSRTWGKETFKAFREYQVKYYKENYRTFALRFNKEVDGDIIAFYESQDNLTDFLRQLTRREMARLEAEKTKEPK
ncbi:MAG: hypothetical protein IJI83_03005 [Oscillospiraceae bacterium]|nr:hypothetical protein [Oscillospiraceae bacterium]